MIQELQADVGKSVEFVSYGRTLGLGIAQVVRARRDEFRNINGPPSRWSCGCHRVVLPELAPGGLWLPAGRAMSGVRG